MISPEFKEFQETNRNLLKHLLKPVYLSLDTPKNEIPFRNKTFVITNIFLNSKT